MHGNRLDSTGVRRSCSRRGRLGRAMALLVLSATLLVALHSTALAQGRQTGTVRGSVVDAQGLVHARRNGHGPFSPRCRVRARW